MAVAATGVPRLLLLLLLCPVAVVLHVPVLDSRCACVLLSDIKSAVHGGCSWCAHRGTWCSQTRRELAEPFLRECLGVDAVVGTEIATWRGHTMSFVDVCRGVLVGHHKSEAL